MPRPEHDDLTVDQVNQIQSAQRKMENKQVEQQRRMIDHQLRVQCVEQAIRAAAATPTVAPSATVAETAREIYDFVSAWNIERLID